MAKKKRGRKTNKRKNLKFIYILIMIVVVVFTCYYFKDEIMDAISQIINTSSDDSSANDNSSSEERETTTTLVNTRFKNTISNWSFLNTDNVEATPSFNEFGEFKFENLNDKLKSPTFSNVDELTITLFISSFTNNINTATSDKNYIFLINGFNESNEVVATLKVDSLALNENIFTLKGNKISYIEISMDGYYLIKETNQTINLQSINVKCDSSLITSGIVENYTYDNLQIYFLELGSYKTGDSVFIKANDIDILISASDLTKVEKILTKLNFKQGYYDYKKNKIILFSRKEIINRRINRGETAPFVLKTSNKIVPFIEIDLNFSVNETANDTLSNKLLNNTIAYLSIKNTYIRSLSKYDFVIFLIMHAYKEMNVLFMIKHNKDLLLYKFLDLYLLLKDMNLLTLYNLIVEYNIEKEAKLVIQATAILFKCEALTNYLNNFSCDEKLIIKDYENKKNYIFTNSIQERILNFNNLKYLKEIDYE